MKTIVCLAGILCVATAAFSEPVDTRFGFDQPASIEWITGERIAIELDEISDSRCAIGATCVWEGDVTVASNVTVNGVSAEDVSITLHGEEFDRAVAMVDGFRIQLAAVGPYPVIDTETERSSYRVTAVVSPVTEFELTAGLSALNTQWRLDAFGKLGQEVTAMESTPVTIRFDISDFGTGSMSGSGGCNGFTGSVQAASIGAIVLSDIGFTDMACGGSEGVMQQEDRFFAELPHVIGFTMTENRLVLPYATINDEVGTMIFSRLGPASTAVSAMSWGQVKERW